MKHGADINMFNMKNVDNISNKSVYLSILISEKNVTKSVQTRHYNNVETVILD